MSADVVYLDTSAAVKLLVREPESAVLRRSLRTWSRRASCGLLRVELRRAVRRVGGPHLAATAEQLLARINLIRLDDTVLDRAAALEPVFLRSLDAIHLSAAISLGQDLGALITYDQRMAESAVALGLPVLSPG